MIKFTEIIKKIESFKTGLGGVFTYADLFHLIGSDPLTNRRAIRKLVGEGALTKVKRGFYVTEAPELGVLALKMRPDCYISMETALAKNGLLGTLSSGVISAVYPGVKGEEVELPTGLIRFFSIKKNLVFGTQVGPQGVRMADSEKAYLDLLYYHNRGVKFPIDPLSEVKVSRLNRQLLMKYLANYRNPKFKSFVKGMIRESSD